MNMHKDGQTEFQTGPRHNGSQMERSGFAPWGLTCNLASILQYVTGWHCGITYPHPFDPECSLFHRRVDNCLIKQRDNSLTIAH